MNLHAIVAPYIATVNPMLRVGIKIAAGVSTQYSGKQVPTYETPGAFTGSIGTGNLLTAASVTAGVLKPGQTIAGAGVATGSMIVRQISGTAGGAGVYQLANQNNNISAELMTTSLSLLAQVQPLTGKDLRQIEGLNLNGDVRAIYLNGDLNGVVRVAIKGGDIITLPDGSVFLVNQQLEGWNVTSGWTKAVMTLQLGS